MNCPKCRIRLECIRELTSEKHSRFWCKKCGIDWQLRRVRKGRRRTEKEQEIMILKAKELALLNNQKRRKMIKMQVLIYYSHGVPQCGCCGELIHQFLTIDHNERRNKWNHPKEMSGHRLYLWLIKNNFPDGFSVLCFNCNMGKGFYDICPHKSLAQPIGIQNHHGNN